MKSLIFALTFLSLSATAFAKQTINLRSRDGVALQVRYDLEEQVSNSNKPSSSVTAVNIEFEAQALHLGSDEKIRVVVVNFEDFKGSCGLPSYKRDPNYVIDLRYSPARRSYVGKFEDARIILNGREVPLQPMHRRGLTVDAKAYCQSTETRQEFAFVVNDRWQRDPVNGTNNFKVNFWRR